MDNVINLFSRRNALKSATQARVGESTQSNKSAVGSSDTTSFSDVAERNRANQQRLRKERETANKNVLKSYRIK